MSIKEYNDGIDFFHVYFDVKWLNKTCLGKL
jgi:hypothetical protein